MNPSRVLEEFTVKEPTAEQLKEWFENPDFVQYNQNLGPLNNECILLGGGAEHSDFNISAIIMRNSRSGALILMVDASDNEDYSFCYGNKFIIQEAKFTKRLVSRIQNDENQFGVEKSVRFQGKRKSQYFSASITFWGREE